MISREEIDGLADLARLRLTDEEAESLRKDVSAILAYVGQVGAVAPAQEEKKAPAWHNVMRGDLPRLASGKAGDARAAGDPLLGKEEALRAAFPKREGDYNVVRKILQKDE